MMMCFSIVAPLALMGASAASAAAAASAPASGAARISVDASKPGPRLNPRMYGIFLEEINHGVDGGLYAELVANRAFEDSRPPEGCELREGRWKDALGWDAGFDARPGAVPRWSLVCDGGARGTMHLETTGGLNESSPYCLRLDIEDSSQGRIGVANGGFWGMNAVRGAAYDLAIHARARGSFAGPLVAFLEGASGAPCSAPATFEGFGPDWKRFNATLTATADDPKARLVIAARSPGTVWLDFVSLFPHATWKGRPNGLRPDLAQLIADMKPGFVRFPGGCVVEGGTVETAYNWKLTVGPVEARPERWNAWNYRRTHGMGLYEYFLFCEDLSAEPMWVGFAGQTCLYRHAEHVPTADMGWVVSGFLDIIEYANGAADSKWGSMRARSGHPEPFDLTLVEIGNENGGREYEERYRAIHAAVKARFPAPTYIADYAIPRASYDMIDEHYYSTPHWFLSQFERYDRRDRSQPPIYIGEIAVTSPEGGEDKGNLISALAEGAFLLGLERNADVVRMVSYAPLLAHVSGRSGWHGMIYFDSSRSYGTASYHLWKLLGVNRPDFTVATDVTFDAPPRPPIAGAIGLGTWDTAAEFKDVRVTKGDRVLYEADFSRGASSWRTEGGAWSVESGAYRQRDRVVGLSFAGDPSWSDYTIALKARKIGGAEGFLVAFGVKGEDRYWWNIGGWGNREHGIEFNRTPVGRRVPGTVETGRWYDIKVELAGRRIRCYLDGTLIHDATAVDTQAFFAVAGRDEKSGDLLLRVINTSATPAVAAIVLAGVDRIAPEAECTVLTSGDPKDNNSLEDPAKVVPVTKKLGDAGMQFRHEFPANSFTLLRLRTK